ncbi:competence damage-inducible protein A [Escherichia coli]|nr:competence damage-inducible protein A [Escherichia coli]
MTDSELMQLSEQVGQALKARGATVTTAESCTGGWVAKVITDIAGSSAWFERGFVTYSNEAKAQMIGVREETLAAAWRGERTRRGGNGDRRTESGSC